MAQAWRRRKFWQCFGQQAETGALGGFIADAFPFGEKDTTAGNVIHAFTRRNMGKNGGIQQMMDEVAADFQIIGIGKPCLAGLSRQPAGRRANAPGGFIWLVLHIHPPGDFAAQLSGQLGNASGVAKFRHCQIAGGIKVTF